MLQLAPHFSLAILPATLLTSVSSDKEQRRCRTGAAWVGWGLRVFSEIERCDRRAVRPPFHMHLGQTDEIVIVERDSILERRIGDRADQRIAHQDLLGA